MISFKAVIESTHNQKGSRAMQEKITPVRFNIRAIVSTDGEPDEPEYLQHLAMLGQATGKAIEYFQNRQFSLVPYIRVQNELLSALMNKVPDRLAGAEEGEPITLILDVNQNLATLVMWHKHPTLHCQHHPHLSKDWSLTIQKLGPQTASRLETFRSFGQNYTKGEFAYADFTLFEQLE